MKTKRPILGTLFLLLLTGAGAFGGQKASTNQTVVNDSAAKAMLLGAHRLSLQWISWDHFGKAVVTDQKGRLVIRGEQRSKNGKDFVRVDGAITRVEAKEFTFNGTIEIRSEEN